jgi:hypothetical protein
VQLVKTDRNTAMGKDARHAASGAISPDYRLLQVVPDATIVTDRSGRIVFVNGTAERLFAYGPGELVGQAITILLPERVRGIHPSHVESYFSEPRLRNLGERDDLVGRRKDGSEFAVDIKLSPYQTPDGVVAIASIRDITKQRAAAAALRRSEEFLRLSQKVGRIGSWESCPDTMRVRWSEEVYEILGVRPGDFDGRHDTVVHMVHPDDRARVLAHSRNDAPEGRQQAIEYRIVRRVDGAERTVRAESMVLPDPAGRLRVVGTIQDITEQQDAATALREAQTLSGQLVDQSLIGISIVQDGRLVFVNSTLAEFSGYTREEMLARPDALETVPEEDRATIKEAMQQRFEDPSAQVRYTTRVRRKDGQLIHLEVHGGQVQYRGRPALIAAALNVTDRIRLEEQMIQVQKMELVGRLAGGIAHDFNNVLTVVTGHCEALKRRLGTDGVHHSHVTAIQRAADRAAALTRQLLSFGRRQLAEPKFVDLNQIVTTLRQLLPRLIGEHIETVVSLAQDLRPIRVDPGQLEQVILNLVMNARDAMPDGGTLRIVTGQVELDEAAAGRLAGLHPGAQVTLTVEDTGQGMDESTRSQLFEPFFTTKEVGRGVGLGLSTVHGIIAQSGGAITVDTELGRGSAFTIYFPPVEGDLDPTAAEEETAPAPRGSETLLVVEDETPVRELVEQTLGELGYTVLSASSGQDALGILSGYEGPIDLLVTDVVMPRMSGDELAQQIAERFPAVRVLFVSGYADEVLGRHGTLDADIDLLRKPFSAVDLARKIRLILDSH